MKLFKKAYISIEVVILASLVIIGGMAGLSAFMKNGQGAQAQSATMINDTIETINEDFSFAGAGNLPEDDGLNSYGFYFGKRYNNLMCMVDDPSDCYTVGYMFYEDGSMKRYMDGELNISKPAGTFTYETGKALSVSNNYEFISNGTIMRALGGSTEFELEE